MLESAKLTNEKLDAFHVGFVLAPRLNACGRMGHARLAVELLTDAPLDRCRKIAKYLAQQNTERQRVERAITAEAIQRVESLHLDAPENRAIVLWSDEWHGGVIGIVASRLVDRFGRPAILVAINGDGRGQGSGRSIPGFHLRDAMAACSKHLRSFGGHAMAGGLRIDRDRIEAFASDMAEYARQHVSAEDLTATLDIDAECSLAELNLGAVQHLARLGPYGQGNPEPVVAVRNCRLITSPRRMGRSGATIGMLLGQGDVKMRAVGFNMGDLADILEGVRTIDVAATPSLNCFQGNTTVELKLKDVRWG
jgi:single-stranded-DNA-specific exonuclease